MPAIRAWFDPLAATNDTWRRGHTTAVFEAEQPLRDLVVVVSDEVLAEEDDDRVALLLGLLHDPMIRLYRYADDGPPAEVERRTVTHFGEVADGWLIVHGADAPDGGSVVYTNGDHVTRSRLGSSEAVRFAASDGAETYFHLGFEESHAQAGRDALCAVAADGAGADLLVTRRAIALDPPFKLVRGPLAVVTPEDALPVVGLYLRRQGAFIAWRSIDASGTYKMNRGSFYMVAARDQLPSGWRWMSRCVHADALSGESTLSWLGTSVFDRVARSIEARDHLHRSLSQPQDNDVAGDALLFLDLVLVSLMGAFDAAARVAHIALDLPSTDLYKAAWQSKTWRERCLGLGAPAMADYMTAGGPQQAVLTVLRLLRNSVHGEALSPLSVSMQSPRRRDDTLVGLPRRERSELESALAQLGGLDAWGIREMIPGRLHADARVLIERLLPAALAVLDGIMRLTPVDLLPVADDADLQESPPSDQTPFGDRIRVAVRWQLGLDDPMADDRTI